MANCDTLDLVAQVTHLRITTGISLSASKSWGLALHIHSTQFAHETRNKRARIITILRGMKASIFHIILLDDKSTIELCVQIN